jgi:nitric oxide reductase NorD protein
MTLAADLSARYAAELRGYGASLPDEFEAAAAALEAHLDAEQLDAWASAGVTLANHSLRSWEATAEYFRASPRVVEQLHADGMQRWVDLALQLADQSSLMAAAYLRATPGALEHITAQELETWAKQGERLCRGNWKSIALASLFYQVSPQLLSSLPLASVTQLVGIIDTLTERSYELATACLESAGNVFAGLAERDREPFLRFAHAVTQASWADTRLYFERGPRLLDGVQADQRARFLELAAGVTTDVGRQGFPLFADAAQALAEMPQEMHGTLLLFASRVAPGSASAAMEYLKIAPFIASRLTPEQMDRWAETGFDILTVERNPEGAEAFFRLESARAEESLRALSARVELGSINSMLRMYAKALSGEHVSIQSSEELVDRQIGWVTDSVATTEGSTIYLPPYVSTFEQQNANFQVYKVYTTHQAGRLEFGSFNYRWGIDGALTTSSAPQREEEVRERLDAEATKHDQENGAAAEPEERPEAATAMQRYFNLFEDRQLISGAFTVVEDTRVDAYVAREYGGIRRWLRDLQEYEVTRRPRVDEMPLRRAFVENLLRASLGKPEAMRWPVAFREELKRGLAALKVVEEAGATVQDSAEAAAAIYEIAASIPNIVVQPDDKHDFQFEPADDDLLSVQPGIPSGGGEGSQQGQPNEEEMAFENPPQPDFRGDFKPELVQLLSRLKEQQDGSGDGAMSPLTRDQLMELLENSVELSISEWSDGDIDSSLGMFLDNLEKEAGTPSGDPQEQDGDSTDGESTGGGGDEGELPPQIDYFFYDEWDFRAGDYRPRWTRVGERFSEEGENEFYDETLRRYHGLVLETRRQFELMRPESFRKLKRLEDGDELDLDLAIEFYVDKRAGVGPQARVYNRRNKIERDVAVAFLLDMSASTDEEIEKQRQKYDDGDDDFDGDPRKYFQWLAARRAKAMVEPPKRIIDLEKESSVLIVEALEAIGDSYGIYGFSGYGRENVEFHVIKDLDEPYSDRVQRRIGKIEPIRSTRMGPAIRHTVHKLDEYDAKVKILILVSDGRPQDHGYGRDRTEKEYAVHDTKQALVEAKRKGITPFLITVDKEGHDYLKQMCDDIGYEVVDDIESLPRRLPTLYRHLAME